MRFKDFLKLEDGGSSEQGLFVNYPTQGRKPSDGHLGAQWTNSFAGAKSATAGAGGMNDLGAPGAGALMMNKFMKRFMKKMRKS